MRSHVQIWLLACSLVVFWDGPAVEAAGSGDLPDESREAATQVLMVAPAALPACPWTPAVEGEQGLEAGPGDGAASASVAPPSPALLRAREMDWLSFRRPFSHTVSYRSTAPPARIA